MLSPTRTIGITFSLSVTITILASIGRVQTYENVGPQTDERKTFKSSDRIDNFFSKVENDIYDIDAQHDVMMHRERKISTVCPHPCQCKRDLTGIILTVDCSVCNLKEIPPLPLTSQHVFLQNNNIKNISCINFTELKHLLSLDLSANQINNIQNCSFGALALLQKLDLSGNMVEGIHPALFNSLHNLQWLNLSGNGLGSFAPQHFGKLIHLKTLDASNNAIRQIKRGTFHGLGSLLFLALHSNRLRYTSSTFDKNAFEGLHKLKTLKLHGNQLEFSASFRYPDKALSHLRRLEILSLDGYPSSLGPGFRSLNNLTLLTFGEMGSSCNMLRTKMLKKFFSNINTSNPLDISLTNCNISFLPSDVFKFTPTIKSLYLDDNGDLGFQGFEHGSLGLRNSNLTLLSIDRIVHERFQYVTHITNTTFKNLRRTKLRNLTIEHNFVQSISPFALRDLPPTLEYLSLFDNKLSSYIVLQDLILLKNLRVLELSEQNVHHYSKPTGRKKNSMKDLPSEERTDYHLAVSEIKDFDRCGSKMKTRIVVLPRKLEELYFNYAKGDVDSYSQLKVVNNDVFKIYEYAQNEMRCLGEVTGVGSLEHVDVSRNIVINITNLTFSKMFSVKRLKLGQNILGQSLADDVDGKIFSHLSKLELLDLHRNSIKALAESAFTSNPKLRVLNISQNELRFFKPDLSNNTNLENLDLSTNILTGLTDSTCRQLKRLKVVSPKLKVNISDNRFVCDCSYLEFLSLLVKQPEIFSDIESFHCSLHNGSELYYNKLEEFLPDLSFHCFSVSLFVVALVAFFVTLMSLGIVSTFYYRRWQWRYLQHLGQARLHIGATQFIAGREKHAFVTYNQDEPSCRRFMKEIFLPGLRQLGLSLVFGETDFPAGPLAPSIASAVAITKKTVVLFSKDIFEDSFRELEVNLAIMHEVHMGKPVLVPVLLLDASYRALMRNETTRTMANNRRVSQPALGLRNQDYYESWMDNITYFDPDGLTDRAWSFYEDMLASFPPEISHFLESQRHRCLVYDGGSEEFWESLTYSLLADTY